MAHRNLLFSRLIDAADVRGPRQNGADPTILAVSEDSRAVKPGSCFVAVQGTKVDGHDFIEAALANGAAAVVSERPVKLPGSIAGVVVGNARGVAARMAAVLCGVADLQRDGRLKLIGITGTNGKSTFCFLLQSILRQAGCPTALFGTVRYDLVGRSIEAEMTTPPATRLMDYLAEAADAGATHAVMEVSSHALDQGRCEGLRFSVAAFSNLTGDHLDYHHDMESYLLAKKRLFDGLDPAAVAAVNLEDPVTGQIVADCRARVYGYAVQDRAWSGPEEPAVGAANVEQSAEGTRFDLRVPRHGIVQPIATALVGRHNVQNCLAAASAAIALGVAPGDIAAGLAAMAVVPGRLQRVQATRNGHPLRDGLPTVLVDYAHTDDALRNVLKALRPLTSGRLIVMFGCGGDRDKTKRPRMARIAAAMADRIVLTSDNPRGEDPLAIIADVKAGFEAADLPRLSIEPDRRAAIQMAIGMAAPGDIVLLAGKGHETYQLIAGKKLPFDDVAEAGKVLGTL